LNGDKGRIRTRTRLWKIHSKDPLLYIMLREGKDVERVLRFFKDVKVERREIHGNVFLTEGINFIWRMVTGEAGLTPFDENNSYIGVGNGTDPENASQTGLTGTQKYYKRVDSGYPKINGNQITFRATFNIDEANFTWNEWTVANGPNDNAINLNRKVEALGSKTSGQVWIMEITLSIS